MEVLIVLAAVVVALIYGYNKAIVLKNYVQEAFSTMDVYILPLPQRLHRLKHK